MKTWSVHSEPRQTVRVAALFISLALLLSGFPLSAQAVLSPVSIVRIPFGPERDGIGAERGDGELWHPLFFSVDAEGAVSIPDFYKGRIARYSKDGQISGSVPCGEGISPRMNYFTQNASGGYLSYDGFTLYALDEEGAVIWRKAFPFGFLPEQIRLYEDLIYIGTASAGAGEKLLVVESIGGAVIGSVATFPLQAPAACAGNGKPPGDTAPEKSFLGTLTDGTAVWTAEREQSLEVLLSDTEGKLSARYLVIDPDTSSFATVLGGEGALYRNAFREDHLIIRKYDLEGAH